MSDGAPPRGDGLAVGEDGVARCAWCAASPDYRAYHDTEWGFPVADERRLFEKLALEGFQAGLSWLTILRKRENFRRAFAGFDPERVARFGEADTERLLADAGIVRHRGKIDAVVNNARRVLELRDAGISLGALVWRYAPDPGPPGPPESPRPPGPARPAGPTRAELAARTTTPQATALAAELRRRGWRFVGPTTVYAFMQSMGLVNDHLAGCGIRPAAEAAREQFTRPL